MQIYGDHNGECHKALLSLGEMIKDRDALIREWDEEEKKKPTADEVVKAAIQDGHKPRWKAEDRPFVKKLIDKSLKTAAECSERNEHSLKDIFVAQAARLEQELRQLESLYGVYKEPAPDKKARKKAKRRKR